ncbi:MAG: acetate--CoA ligase [Thermoplasmata archaeon]|nr:acetate--CoA ligase [Thermoplasmata archaeon]
MPRERRVDREEAEQVGPEALRKSFKKRPNLTDYARARRSFNWSDAEVHFDWHKTGKINMAHEAIDRHADGRNKNKVALHYIDDTRSEKYTFLEMKRLSNKFANVLRKYGIGKGDRVFTFLPRSPEVYISIFGTLKIGAIPSPLFEAFMEDAVRDRIQDSEAVAIVTVPEMMNRIPKKDLPSLKHIFIVNPVEPDLEEGEIDWTSEMEEASPKLNDLVWLEREDPLILHYTSGSTGKPKGVLHAQNAMIGQMMTGKWVLDFQEDDTYWCTSDPGWVTGTSYGMFAPWLNGITNVIRGGRFDADKWYETIEDLEVTVWYSAPTAFRLLMAAGTERARKYNLSSLRYILSVGEPLNPEVIRWGWEAFEGRTIHDNWWMTETGHQLIANYPSMPVRLGSMGRPFPGIEAAIVDNEGKELGPYQIGNLVIRSGWPGMMRRIWNDPKRYKSYFEHNSWFITGDSAFMDEDGYFWFQGRIDDVIKTAGERVGPFEVESKLIEHPSVAAAGVIGKPDTIRGSIIKAFVQLREGYTPSEELRKEIAEFVKKGLAAHAVPREIEFRDKLPITRSGKIMRRVLKAWELGLPTGDLSTMEN